MLRIAPLVLTIACTLSTQTAAALVYLDDGVMSQMTDADVDLFYKYTREALDNTKDDSPTRWENPETGAHGIITPLKTYNAYDTTCRFVRFENFAGDISNTNHFSLCKISDGSWKVAPTDSGMKKTDDSESHAEHCKQLSREIEGLKGKPLRRSAAMDRYDAECKELPPSGNTGGIK
jgi:surface antigen